MKLPKFRTLKERKKFWIRAKRYEDLVDFAKQQIGPLWYRLSRAKPLKNKKAE